MVVTTNLKATAHALRITKGRHLPVYTVFHIGMHYALWLHYTGSLVSGKDQRLSLRNIYLYFLT
jgi:hypothetical protein